MGGSGFNLRSVRVQASRQFAVLFPEASRENKCGEGAWFLAGKEAKRWTKERKKRAKSKKSDILAPK